MLPLGADPLIKLRLSGHIPTCTAWVKYGDYPNPDWHRWADSMHSPVIVVRFADPVARLDLRCLVGLFVTLYLARYDDKAASLFTRLQDYASEIVCMSPDFDEDIGMWWLPRYGVIDYDQRGIVARYQQARDAVIYGGKESARAIEKKLLEENPWLRA